MEFDVFSIQNEGKRVFELCLIKQTLAQMASNILSTYQKNNLQVVKIENAQFIAQKLQEFGMTQLSEQLRALVQKLQIETKIFQIADIGPDSVFDESVADLQEISGAIDKVSAPTRENLIKMNDEFLESIDRSLHLSYSCNTILVDDHGTQIFESCLIVHLFRQIR